jgi:hypothetical protein
MYQVLWGKVGLFDCCVDLRGEGVEGALKRGLDGAESWERGGEAGTQDAIVGSGEEQGDAEAEVGDLVAEATGHALDQAVEAQPAQCGSRPSRCMALNDGFASTRIAYSSMPSAHNPFRSRFRVPKPRAFTALWWP